MGCAPQQQLLDKLNGQKESLQEQFFSPAQKAQHEQQLLAIEKEIATAQVNLANCLQSLLVAAPQRILQIQDTDTPASIAAARAALQALQTKIGEPSNPVDFPEDVDFEWKQPFDQEGEYDLTTVAATGWAVNPRAVNGDFQFSHPFGLDWESSLALDNTAANGSGPFDYLLSVGNKAPTPDTVANDERVSDEADASQLKLAFPLGLLGVEMDGGNIPAGFTEFIKSGNRLAVYGRWIVDCGHQFHRCEIHPPLLMAVANNPDTVTTRALFTSRPYLVGQTYTSDLANIYNDHASDDDGPFYQHLKNEIEKVGTARSTQVEAHPKIKSFPFQGVHRAHFQIRAPQLPATLVAQSAQLRLEVSFNFTVRSGCSVTVTSSAADTIDVVMAMDSSAYQAPKLPLNTPVTITEDQLKAEDPIDTKKAVDDAVELAAGAFAAVGGTAAAIAEGALGLLTGGLVGATIGSIFAGVVSSKGIVTDSYASQAGVDINSTQGAVNNVPFSAIPQNAGVTVNNSDSQPYPVYGWLEAKWAQPTLVVKGFANTVAPTAVG